MVAVVDVIVIVVTGGVDECSVSVAGGTAHIVIVDVWLTPLMSLLTNGVAAVVGNIVISDVFAVCGECCV